MPSISLSSWEFDLLFVMMVNKWKKSDPAFSSYQPKDWIKISGYHTKQDIKKKIVTTENNLAAHINTTLGITRKPVTPSFLYTHLTKLYGKKKRDTIIEIEEPYEDVFFKYLGYDNHEDFRRKTSTTYKYKGMYFSKTKAMICDFEFDIIIPPQVEGVTFLPGGWINTRGFHTNIDTTTLEGKIEPYNKSWIAFTGYGEYYIHLAIYTSEAIPNIKDLVGLNQLFGSICSLSSRGHLINVECVLMKLPNDPQTELYIRRYLNVRMNYFGIYTTEEDHVAIEGIKTADVSINELESYADKTFRILAEGPDDQYIQSRFRINADYSATINVPKIEKGKDLHCKISIDNVPKDRLIVNSYLRNELYKIYTSTIIEFVSKPRRNTILKGKYVIVDRRFNDKLWSYKFVLTEDKSDFELGIYKKEETETWREGDIKYNLLQELNAFTDK